MVSETCSKPKNVASFLVFEINEERLRHRLEDRPHESPEEFANFAESRLRIRNQPDLVDLWDRRERDERQERDGLAAGEDYVLDGAARRVEEVFGVPVSAPVEVKSRIRFGPLVDLAQ
jgi:hypothetical protein